MPLLTKEFENHILSCLKDAIEAEGPDLFNDLIEENPDYWAEKLNKIFFTQVTKALKNKKLIKEVLKQLLEENYPVENIIEDILKEGLKSGKWLNKLIKTK